MKTEALSTDQRTVLPAELRDLYSELMKIAAELVRGIVDEPELPASTSKTVRQRVAVAWEKSDERGRVLGIRVRAVIDKFPRVPYARVVHHVTSCKNCAGGD